MGPQSPFARLAPLAGEHDDVATGMAKLAQALSGFGRPIRINFRLVKDKDGQGIDHWDVQGGDRSAKATRNEPSSADVILVIRPETLNQIVQGRLAPYDALFSGKLRVGGDFELAKAMTRHLTDPAATYISPCG